MTRLGFVGVGKHAQKMAAAFRECGAEVVAYWRKRLPEYDGPSAWGALVPWRDQIASPDIDALIICAPPGVTTEVALACAKAGKRCVATKPLMWTKVPRDIALCNPGFAADSTEGGGDDLYVDLWRLYSPAWQAMKAELRGKQVETVQVDFYGNGPVRGFYGLLDYGPHALAFVADLLGEIPSDLVWQERTPNCWAGEGDLVSVHTGNGAETSAMRVRVITHDDLHHQWAEVSGPDEGVPAGSHVYRVDSEHGGAPIMVHDRSLALRAFCRSFLAGEPSDTLRLSCEAMRVLMPMVAEWRN